VVPNAGATLSAAARAYNLQLARVDKLKAQMAEMEALSLAHRQALTQQVFPLNKQHQALMKQMALWLDAQLTQPISHSC
jgi:phosphate-selective porin